MSDDRPDDETLDADESSTPTSASNSTHTSTDASTPTPHPTGADRKAAVARGYDALAGDYDDARALDAAERESVAALRETLGSPSRRDTPRVLDAGCGAGVPVLERLAAEPSVEAVGLDVAGDQLRRARRFAAVVRGDMARLPVASDAVDAVTAFHSTIHVPTDEHAELYAEFARVLRTGGHLLVTVGDDAWTGTNPDWLDAGAAMHWSFPSMSETRDHLAAAGFTVVREWTTDDEIGGGDWPVLLCRLSDGSTAAGSTRDRSPAAGSPTEDG